MKKVAHIIVKLFICAFGINESDRMGNKKIFGVHPGKANMLSCVNTWKEKVTNILLKQAETEGERIEKKLLAVII